MDIINVIPGNIIWKDNYLVYINNTKKQVIQLKDIEVITYKKHTETFTGPLDSLITLTSFKINLISITKNIKIIIDYNNFSHEELVKLIKTIIRINPLVDIDPNISKLLTNKYIFKIKKTWEELKPNLLYLGIIYELTAIFFILQNL